MAIQVQMNWITRIESKLDCITITGKSGIKVSYLGYTIKQALKSFQDNHIKK